MSFKIVNKQVYSDQLKRLDIAAPAVAAKVKPGQFVRVCPEDNGASLALTVVDHDTSKGNISVIVQATSPVTTKFINMSISDTVYAILGPLGTPSSIERKGDVVCIATGIGIARILPVCRALKKKGNRVYGIIGARTKKELMLEPQMRLACDKIFITTEDGSYERRGLATDMFREVIGKQKVERVYAIGSVEMMEAVCGLTKELKIETRVTLNLEMVDCVGLCGSCRVRVGGRVVLGCIDGPEFDGHAVDFEELKVRMNALKGKQAWDNPQTSSSPNPSGSKTLPRFLSDILKS